MSDKRGLSVDLHGFSMLLFRKQGALAGESNFVLKQAITRVREHGTVRVDNANPTHRFLAAVNRRLVHDLLRESIPVKHNSQYADAFGLRVPAGTHFARVH